MRTPRSVANRPGLPALRYRVGTYSDFVATMLARLSSSEFPALRGLRTRERSDWTIALLDAWAVAGDVLTFYQERIANEGYLGTATQLRSVVELARLVGYERRPGVSASTRLAFTLDPGAKAEIPTGTRARSVPGPGETAQTFETSAPLMARAGLNRLGLRPSRPQVVTATTDPLWLAGVDLAIKPADALLVRTAGTATPVLRRVAAVEEDRAAGRTGVRFSNPPKAPRSIVPTALPQLVKALAGEVTTTTAIGLIEGGAHEVPPPFPEASDTGDAHLRLLSTFRPGVAAALAGAWAAADATEGLQTQAWALRVRAPVFGHNAPPMIVSVDDETHAPTFGEWVPLQETSATQIDLDAPHDKMAAGDWAVVDYSGVPEGDHSLPSDGAGVKYGPKRPLITRVRRVIPSVSRQDYGMSATTARLELENEWINLTPPVVINGDSPPDLSFIRNTVVYTLAEELALAEQPIDDDVMGDVLELDGLYEGIEPDRTLIVTGERTDVPGTTGVMATEVVEVMAVAHAAATAANATRPGDAVHTWVRLDQPLRHRYRRSSVVVYGNVAHATNGESRAEILGSGDGAKALQRFALRKPPLTFVSAPTPSGLASSMEVRVNDLRWPEVASLTELGPSTRGYVTQTDAAAVTSVVFGDGVHGRRLPTGAENVRARYRDGIGKQANVAAGAISLLATKPLGVKEVVNPVPATGGADADRVDQTRENAPLPLRALDRLVSLSDYADLARTFAGVGKAAANRLLDGRRQVVLVSVAGVDDIPLDPDSDVITNLLLALRRFGDPDVYLAVRPRELLLAQLELALALDADRDPDVVAAAVRTAVAAALGFDARTLGQDLTESEVLRAVHQVPGVAWARLDRIEALRYADGTTEIVKPMESPDAAGQPYHPGRRILALEARTDDKGIAQPAQLLYLSAGIPETLAITVEAAR